MTVRITKGSGNVYADLGLKNPDDHALKAEFVRRIAARLESEGLNQTEAAARLGIAQPDAPRMLHGHFRQFSAERLMRFLVALGHDVEIVVKPVPAGKVRRGRLAVVAD